MTEKATVLIVEDETIIAKGIEKRLNGLGYAVAGLVSSGEVAVPAAADLRPDIVLMDIRLGDGMDGVEAAALIREQLAVPVVFLTAYSDESTIERAKLTEPFGYVLKPYEDKDLQTAIEIGLYKHRMEQRLRENEQWLAATLGSIGDGVIATDERGRVRLLNFLARRLTGWEEIDALDRDVREVFHIVHERSRQPVPNPALEALRTGQSVALAENTVLVARDGTERPIDDSAAPILDAAGRLSGAVLVFRDVTERRRLEEHLRQAQKMEAIGRLAGGIAHDFNNIMTIITGYTEILQGEAVSPEARRQFLGYIHEAGKRAAGLTQQILAFSRKQMLVHCVLNLNAVVRDMTGLVRQLLGPNIAFVIEPAPDLGDVEADPTQVGQVILNLAVNARDAMPRGGRLIVATADVTLDEEAVRAHPDVKPGRYVRLTVRDTGSGISPEILGQIFEPFFTTKAPGQGTGLGLSTVYGIVKQSGGHIEVASQPGEGTTFRIFLPRLEEPQATPTASLTSAPRGSETILLVENDTTVREMTKMVLERHGYTVLEALDGREAVGVGDRHAGEIHLLMTNVLMEEMNGRQLADTMKASRPGTRVLFLSAYTKEELAPQGVEDSTADLLHKPFNLDALARKVREVLDRPAGTDPAP